MAPAMTPCLRAARMVVDVPPAGVILTLSSTPNLLRNRCATASDELPIAVTPTDWPARSAAASSVGPTLASCSSPDSSAGTCAEPGRLARLTSRPFWAKKPCSLATHSGPPAATILVYAPFTGSSAPDAEGAADLSVELETGGAAPPQPARTAIVARAMNHRATMSGSSSIAHVYHRGQTRL